LEYHVKLDERQQNMVMWGLGGILGAVALYYLILNPLYFARRAKLDKDIATQQKLFNENEAIKKKAADANKKWRDLNIRYLADSNIVEAELRDSLLAASDRNAGNFTFNKMSINAQRPLVVPRTAGRTDTKTDFTEIKFTATAFTSTSRIGRFLAMLERMKMPAKIERIKIVSRKSGSDDLQLEIAMSALVYSPRPGAAGTIIGPAGLTPDGQQITGVAPGLGNLIKPLDPALPPGSDLAERMRLRRTNQIKALESSATAPK
jgi:hypothetical protein